ncbi:SusC/RagA family TonB-linked outer membrane protein [Prolixibacteraceae bacterium Z1-6]|uniref:SusC/RagA family TonB-linked outer membrane protein n=1 Tax=Draconibacterium aestuarii TaxID=2998507 RepID=A0A9X3F6N8_9BACT|nr:SusC/RagA family TonB-linked outer membrane protein [Prolixibacteraceae bacterium Z1-6]
MKKSATQNSLQGACFMHLPKLLLVGILLISQLGVFAQTKNISGTVTGNDGAPIPGLTVIVKGTAIGTVTTPDGTYILSDVPENATLVFSFVGMKTQEIVVGNQTVINVTMQTDAIGLDEVVAIGYGTARKKDLTGSVVNVSAEQLEKYQPASVSEMLRSAVPGLKVGYSTDAKNTPDFNIRGDNTIKANDNDENNANRPLIVLDGVIFNGDIAEINVNDVESIDVLKDASAAAIYGSRASNGVIVFTTKKGAFGKAVVRVGAKLGVVTGAKRMHAFKAGDEVTGWLTDMNEAINSLTLDPWSKFDKYENVPSEYQSDWLQANGIPGETDPTVITTAWLDAFGLDGSEKENFLAGREFDWQDFYFHTGLRQDYDVSVSGRTNTVSYYWSLGYIDSESVQVGESYKSFTSRLNLDVKVADFLNMGVNANFTYQDEGDEAIGSGGYRTASPYDSPWENIVWTDETIPDSGTYPDRFPREYLRENSSGSNRSNPYLNPAWITRKYDRYRIFPTMYAKLSLPFGIKLTSRMTTRLDFRKRFYYEDSGNPGWSHGGYARRHHNESFEWQWDNILNWDKEFGEHRFSATGLLNAEKNQMWETFAGASNFSPTEALGYHGMVFGLIPTLEHPDESITDEVITRNALMGRINYAFGNRYNLSASVRRDGYSRFGVDNVYATFPSVSAAWNITNEAFMAERPTWLTFMKLRASWGVNGNSSGLGSYAAYARLSDNKYLNYDGGYFVAPYLYINRMANPELAWEKNKAFNLGIDYGMWDGRLRGSLDVYSSKTNDMLLDKKLPTVTGFPSITTNVGSLKNTGFELSINTINIESSEFSWTSQLNIAYNKNEIISLTGEKIAVTDANGNTVMKEPDDIDNGWFIGESKDVIWDYELDGVYQIGEEAEAAKFGLYPGDFRYVDQDDNGVINSDDKVFQGLSDNPWYATFRNDVEYKGFDFGVIFLAKLGYKGGSNFPFNNRQEYIKNHNWFDMPYWLPTNPINDAARINSINLGGANYWQPKSYVRLQNIALGYNLPTELLEGIKISRARIAFNIDNVAVFTKWNIGDPESEREMPRTYSFSVDFSF